MILYLIFTYFKGPSKAINSILALITFAELFLELVIFLVLVYKLAIFVLNL